MLRVDPSCPHCGTRISAGARSSTLAAALLGLAVACSGKDGATTDSGTTPTTDDTTTAQPAYGISTTNDVADADTDADSDADADADADADSDADADTGGSGTFTTGGSGPGGVEPLYGVTVTGGSGR